MKDNRIVLQSGMLFKPFPSMLKESIANPYKPFLVEGIIQRADAINHNRRKYPKAILMREANKMMKELVAEHRAYGELDHPDRDSVEIKNASHTIEDLYWKGNDLCGVLEVLNTPCGNIVRNILEAKKVLGISSRALGSLKESTDDDDVSIVQDDLELIAFDVVSSPSTHGAFLTPKKMNESRQRQKSNPYININTIIREIICSNGTCKIN